MNLVNIILLVFLLGAFAIGISLADNEMEIGVIDSALDNATITILDISIEPSNVSTIPNAEGLFMVVEKYLHFVGVFLFEVFRTGIHFGYDNPRYFEPDFIISVIKLIVWAIVISLLIKPAFYVLIFIVMGTGFIIDKIKSRRRRDKEATNNAEINS